MPCCELPLDPCSTEDALMTAISEVTSIPSTAIGVGFISTKVSPRVVVSEQGETGVTFMTGFRRSIRRYQVRVYGCTKKEVHDAQTAIVTDIRCKNLASAEGFAVVGVINRNGLRREYEKQWRSEIIIRLVIHEPVNDPPVVPPPE